MTVDATAFRAVLGQWPTGVAVVTTSVDGTWYGLTASSFSSVSLDPPLVSVCIATGTPTHDRILQAGGFAVNLLGKDHVDVGKRFAGGRPALERFDGLRCDTAHTGAPLLHDAVGWVDCRIEAAHPAGDHTLYIGRVVAADVTRTTAPLLYHSRSWGQLADVLPESLTITDVGTLPSLAGRGSAYQAAAGALREAGVTHVRVPTGSPPIPGVVSSWLVHDVADLDAATRCGIEQVDVAEPDLAGPAHARSLAVRVLLCDGFSDPATAAARVAAAIDAGADEVCLHGTTDPMQTRLILQDVVGRTGRTALAVALDDSNALGLANALTALKSGVSRFDTSIGGIGGELAAEDLLYLADRLTVTTSVDRDRLVAAARSLETDVGDLPGRTHRLDRLDRQGARV